MLLELGFSLSSGSKPQTFEKSVAITVEGSEGSNGGMLGGGNCVLIGSVLVTGKNCETGLTRGRVVCIDCGKETGFREGNT